MYVARFLSIPPCLLFLLLPASLCGTVLEDYDILAGTDPFGGSYLYWSASTRFFMNAASTTGDALYEEKDWDGDEDEELSVSIGNGGQQVVFRYFNDTVGGPSSDPFYSLLGEKPVFRFNYRNPSAATVLLSVAVETGTNQVIPLPGTTQSIAPGEAGLYRANLGSNVKLASLINDWSGGPLRFMLLQETRDGIANTIEYDNFLMEAADASTWEPTPLEIAAGEWSEDEQLGWIFGDQDNFAWSPGLGWFWHAAFPWVYHEHLGWVHLAAESNPSNKYFHSSEDGFIQLSANLPFWAYRFLHDDWQDLETGELYFEGSRLLRSVTTEQPESVPGNWSFSTQPKPALSTLLGRPDPEVPVYGLYCWAGEYLDNRDFIKAMGWRHFRLSGPIYDQVVRAYSEDGARVMFTIAARDPFTSEWKNRASFESDEAFIDYFLDAISRVLNRYGPDGTFWQQNTDLTHRPIEAIEVFNEPNFWYLNMTEAEKDAGLETKELKEERIGIYAKLLPAAYAHIKENWPSVTVVGFGAGGAASADVGFISSVHNDPSFTVPAYDVLSTHPYVRPVPPETNSIRAWGNYSMARNNQTIRSVMSASGASDKPVWWTELGWSVDYGFYSEDPDTVITKPLQAAYYIRSYARALRLGVERLTFMSVVDTDGVNFGLMERNGTWRPSAYAVQNMINLMPHPRLLATVIESGDDRSCAYTFDPDVNDPADQPVTMAWSVLPENRRLEVLWDDSAPDALTVTSDALQVVDMMGNTTTYTREDGPLAIKLGPYPVFIVPMD